MPHKTLKTFLKKRKWCNEYNVKPKKERTSKRKRRAPSRLGVYVDPHEQHKRVLQTFEEFAEREGLVTSLDIRGAINLDDKVPNMKKGDILTLMTGRHEFRRKLDVEPTWKEMWLLCEDAVKEILEYLQRGGKSIPLGDRFHIYHIYQRYDDWGVCVRTEESTKLDHYRGESFLTF